MLHRLLSRSPARLAAQALGLGYLGAAGFHVLVTLRADPAEQFWPGGFGDTAWLAPYQWVLRHVVAPNGTAFTLALATFLVVVGVHLLAGGRRAEDGLAVATVFVLLLVPALPLVLVVLNLALAALQVVVRRALRAERLHDAALGSLRHA